MLNYELTPNHTGIALWGDYPTLERLHQFVHKVAEQSIVIENKEGFILGLAYDVRKAFEGQRSESYADHGGNRGKIFGVKILWPVILVQVGVLRHAMPWHSSQPIGSIKQSCSSWSMLSNWRLARLCRARPTKLSAT